MGIGTELVSESGEENLITGGVLLNCEGIKKLPTLPSLPIEGLI
jgi:hypothetical protein